MATQFATTEWVERFAEELASSRHVAEAGRGWIWGPITLTVNDGPGIAQPVSVRIDIHEGAVRSVTETGSVRTPFIISGGIERWKAVFSGDLGIVDGIFSSKLAVHGDLPTIARGTELFAAIADTAGSIETAWPDADA